MQMLFSILIPAPLVGLTPITDVPVKVSLGDQNLRRALFCGMSVKSITCARTYQVSVHVRESLCVQPSHDKKALASDRSYGRSVYSCLTASRVPG